MRKNTVTPPPPASTSSAGPVYVSSLSTLQKGEGGNPFWSNSEPNTKADGDSSNSDDYDEDDTDCPLCLEEMDSSDLCFKPCPCGYQICRFCYHRIREEINGKCPACRRIYTDEAVEFSPELPLKNNTVAAAAVNNNSNNNHLVSEDVASKPPRRKVVKTITKSASTQSTPSHPTAERPSGHAVLPSLRHLTDLRVVQRNLVYVIGISARIAHESTLREPEYFGQYGRIVKIVVNRRNLTNIGSTTTTGNGGATSASVSGPSASAYVTFARKEDAARAIACVDGSVFDGRVIRATYGTTKYCSYFLRGLTCTNAGCMYLHDEGDLPDSFTKEELTGAGKMHLHSYLVDNGEALQMRQFGTLIKKPSPVAVKDQTDYQPQQQMPLQVSQQEQQSLNSSCPTADDTLHFLKRLSKWLPDSANEDIFRDAVGHESPPVMLMHPEVNRSPPQRPAVSHSFGPSHLFDPFGDSSLSSIPSPAAVPFGHPYPQKPSLSHHFGTVDTTAASSHPSPIGSPILRGSSFTPNMNRGPSLQPPSSTSIFGPGIVIGGHPATTIQPKAPPGLVFEDPAIMRISTANDPPGLKETNHNQIDRLLHAIGIEGSTNDEMRSFRHNQPHQVNNGLFVEGVRGGAALFGSSTADYACDNLDENGSPPLVKFNQVAATTSPVVVSPQPVIIPSAMPPQPLQPKASPVVKKPPTAASKPAISITKTTAVPPPTIAKPSSSMASPKPVAPAKTIPTTNTGPKASAPAGPTLTTSPPVAFTNQNIFSLLQSNADEEEETVREDEADAEIQSDSFDEEPETTRSTKGSKKREEAPSKATTKKTKKSSSAESVTSANSIITDSFEKSQKSSTQTTILHFTPECDRQAQKLCSIDPASLSFEQLAAHIEQIDGLARLSRQDAVEVEARLRSLLQKL